MHRNKQEPGIRRSGLAARALAVIAALFACGAVVALAEEAPDNKRGNDLGSDAGLGHALSVFRRAQRAGDVMPGAGAAIAAAGDRQPGEDPSLGRRQDVAGGQTAYLWPKADGICYASPGPSGCFPVTILQERGVVLGTAGRSGAPETRVYGIVVDGIREVNFDLDGGQRITVPVKDNGLLADFAARPLQASWRNADGTIGRHLELTTTVDREQELVREALRHAN